MRPTHHEPRDPSGSTATRMVFVLLAGNVFVTACVAAFRPIPRFAEGGHLEMVLNAGTMSLVCSGLLFMLSALRRGQRAWWTLLAAVDFVQVSRLGAALAAMSLWPDDGSVAGPLWGFVMMPSFALLASVGLVITVRELRRPKRRRLSRAA